MQYIFKLHGMPVSMVSDTDAIFASLFWSELFWWQGTDLAMSIAYHPQTDGQTEVVNRSLEQYLRAFTSDRPQKWVEWLPLAEFWFNSNFHTNLKLTPLEALYGFPPPKLQDCIPGTTLIDALDSLLNQRQEVLTNLRGHLMAAQESMKLRADKHRVARSFQVGDWVYLRLQPYRQKTLAYKGKEAIPQVFWSLPSTITDWSSSLQAGITPWLKASFSFPCLVFKAEIGSKCYTSSHITTNWWCWIRYFWAYFSSAN